MSLMVLMKKSRIMDLMNFEEASPFDKVKQIDSA